MNCDAVGRPMEILLVEDSLPDAGLTINALNDGGVQHRTNLVRDGEEAMGFLRQTGRFGQAPCPDLILLDLNLPKKDGREVLDEIKKDQKLRSIPVVIMTASEAHEDFLRSEHLRVDAYINKPIDLKKFTALVKKLKSFWHKGIILPSEV